MATEHSFSSTWPTWVGGQVSIRNRWSRQCLDVDSFASGSPVVQRPCDGTISQRWTSNSAEEAGDAYYRNLTNVYTGLDLNIAGESKALGAPLVQYPRVKGAPNALFRIVAPYHVVD